ncbi:hypothetical protein F2Q69_00008151 [Brassica cretica]|uniref:Uncharacterized protein n=1 Tax=Brassica cretica TaxID=69181 RepID=A0A8S9NNL2_BRACR|nr:hypothetical protein F2Q69_00008151 [Brassica cretica]
MKVDSFERKKCLGLSSLVFIVLECCKSIFVRHRLWLEKKTVEELLALTDLWASSWAYLMGLKQIE